MPWHPRLPSGWPSWNVPIAGITAIYVGAGPLLAPDAYRGGTYQIVDAWLGPRAWGALLVLVGVAVLVWVNRWVAGALAAVCLTWALMLAGSVIIGEGQGKTGHGWIVGCAAMVLVAIVRRGTTPR